MGRYHFTEWRPQAQHGTISSIIIHPNFKYADLESDLAILRLDNDVEFTDFVRPICLWRSGGDIKSMIGQELIVSRYFFFSRFSVIKF